MQTPLHILFVALFVKMSLEQTRDETAVIDPDPKRINQLNLFDS